MVLAIAALVTLAKKSWRDKVWGPTGRFFKWAVPIRLTTTTRIRAKDSEIIVFRASVERALAASIRSGELTAEAIAQVAVLERELEARPKVSSATGLAAPAEQPTAPAIPLPQPRWSIYLDQGDSSDGMDYVIRNTVPRSVAREVRLEAEVDCFEFFDAAHWENMSGVSMEEFRGSTKPEMNWARERGFDLFIEWYDEKQKARSTTISIPATEPAPEPTPNFVAGQSWSTETPF